MQEGLRACPAIHLANPAAKHAQLNGRLGYELETFILDLCPSVSPIVTRSIAVLRWIRQRSRACHGDFTYAVVVPFEGTAAGHGPGCESCKAARHGAMATTQTNRVAMCESLGIASA